MFQIKLCVDNEKTERLLSTSKNDDDWIQSEDDSVEQFQWKKLSEVIKNNHVDQSTIIFAQV